MTRSCSRATGELAKDDCETCLHVWESADDDCSPVSGRAVKQVFVVMPCFLPTTFSPCLRSMMYFFLQIIGALVQVMLQASFRAFESHLHGKSILSH